MIKTDRLKEWDFSAQERMQAEKTGFYRHCTVAAVILFLLLLVSVSPASAKVWTLTTNDTISDNITLASSGDTLILNQGTYYQNGNGINIDKDITIKANASAGGTAENTIIDGGNKNGIFYSSDNTFVIDNLTLKDGKDGNGLGSGVHFTSDGSLTATSCVFSGCSAVDGIQSGGAIYSKTSVVLTSCTFTNCNADNGPDAVYLDSGATCNMNFCRIYKYQDTAISSVDMQISAENNWVGSGSISNIILNADTNPYLKSGITATPILITTSGTSEIKVNLTHNSDGDDTSGSGLFVPDGIPVAFSATSDALSVSGETYHQESIRLSSPLNLQGLR